MTFTLLAVNAERGVQMRKFLLIDVVLTLSCTALATVLQDNGTIFHQILEMQKI